MQSFLRKHVTNYPKLSNSSHSIFHSHIHKTFFSPSKQPRAQFGDHICRRSFHHFQSWQLQQTHSGKFHGSLLAKQLMLKSFNSLQRISSKSLKDLKPKLIRAQFHGLKFDFNPGFDSYLRAWISWFRRLPAENEALGLMVANAAVFVFWRIADQQFMWNNFTISMENIKNGRTLITHAFSHIDNKHVVNNMIPLFFFGTKIGRLLGTEFLLKLYLAGALGSSVFYLVLKTFQALSSKGWREVDPSKIPALGASGAVSAIIVPYIFLFLKAI